LGREALNTALKERGGDFTLFDTCVGREKRFTLLDRTEGKKGRRKKEGIWKVAEVTLREKEKSVGSKLPALKQKKGAKNDPKPITKMKEPK